MIRLNHFTIPVRDYLRSKEWYSSNLGLRVEFEIPERKTVALIDDGGITLFLFENTAGAVNPECTLTFEVDSVDEKYRALIDQGVTFEKSPQKLFWGYGAELRDPDGYLIYLWDEKSMAQKGGA